MEMLFRSIMLPVFKRQVVMNRVIAILNEYPSSSQFYFFDRRKLKFTDKTGKFVTLLIQNPTNGTPTNHSIGSGFFLDFFDGRSLFFGVKRWIQ